MAEAWALVVDDAELGARTVAALLRTAGWRVEVAASCATAHAAASVRLPALVVVDRHLPDGDGVLLGQALGRAHGCRVVVLSGDRPPAQGADGVDVWLQKPVGRVALLAATTTGAAVP